MNEINPINKVHTNFHRQHSDSDEIELREIFSLLKVRKYFIFAVMGLALILASLYVINISPSYRTTALIQIENSARGLNGVLDNIGSSGGGGSSSYWSATPSQVEQALLTSRFVLEPTISSLALNIRATPKYFPFFGAFFFHRYKGDGLAKPFLGLKGYAWGGEQISITKLQVPQPLVSEGFNVRSFKLRARQAGFYSLYTLNGDLILNGEVGRLYQAGMRSKIPGLKILVAKLIANPDTEFSVILLPLDPLVTQLSANLQIADLGLIKRTNSWSQRETGVLNVSLTGSDPRQIPKILNTILYYDIQKNIDKKNVEAQKTMAFLNQQSQILKKELGQAETALSNYKIKKGAFGVSAASQTLLEQMVALGKQIEEIKLKIIVFQQEFTDEHPYILALRQQQNKLQQELKYIESKVANLPRSEQKMLSLEREVKVKSELYVLLLNKIQQMQIIKEGTLSDVRILGLANKPVMQPSKGKLIILGSLLFGFLAAVSIILTRYFLTKQIEDPDYLEENLHLPLFAIIPYSRHQKLLFHEMKRGSPSTEPFVLAIREKQDMAIEGLRSLRTTLQLALQGAKNNIVAILGASPSIGKSFISINLSYVLSDIGKKVLLIDADMRNGKINRYLKQKQSPGLAELLIGTATVEQAIVTLREDKLYFISTGKYPNNPADLLYGNNLQNFLESISKQYDIVIIDTPPVLTMADAASITKHTGVNLLLVGSGAEHFGALKHTVKVIHKNSVKIDGLIFNTTKMKKSHYGYGYGKYKYYYHGYYGKKSDK